jgi:uncharacterized protein (DUF2249 family)
MSNPLSDLPTIDVRMIAPHERHPKIFAMLEALTPKSAMLLLSDHDPLPLRRHLDLHYSGMFDWDYLEAGPDVWRMTIARLAHPGCSCAGHE